MEPKEYIDKALSGLKDFQLATVNYTIEQFYKFGKSKMLIADEVGLGKTIVSRGIVARMYDQYLREGSTSKEFTVIYICSNMAIASQNIEKLNIFYGPDSENIIDYSREDDRITALAYQPKETNNKLNFRIKAFTPATSFDQNTRAGRADERILLFRLLVNHPYLKEKTNRLKWLLKGTRRMNDDNWTKVIDDALLVESGKPQKHYYYGEYRAIRRGVKGKFFKALQEKVSLKQLSRTYERLGLTHEVSCISLLSRICSHPIQKNTYEKYRGYWEIISYLRLKLSECCKDYLEADLFILDEFQRYSNLIKARESDNPAIELARQILNKEGARVLMLSATPFKPYTNGFDELNGEHHYKEFRNVLEFLLKGETADFWKEFESHRKDYFKHVRHLDQLKGNYGAVKIIKNRLQDIYRSCILRTERMLVSENKDAMVKSEEVILDIRKEDIAEFIIFDQIVQHLNNEHSSRLPAPIEYVKSCPYALSFLTNYTHKRKLEARYPNDNILKTLVNKSQKGWLNLTLIQKYQPLIPHKSKDIPNAKVRLLFEKTTANNGWKYLWIPPSLPYYKSQGAFKNSEGYSKTLIFSSWKMVPRMVASLVSYEAERLAIKKLLSNNQNQRPNYFKKKNRFPSPLLKFQLKDEAPAGMNNFMLNYPSIYLSSIYDPADNIREALSIEEIKISLRKQIGERLTELNIFEIGKENEDRQKWSWLAVLLLDKYHDNSDQLQSWLSGEIRDDVLSDVEQEHNSFEEKSGKDIHLQQIKDFIINGDCPTVGKIGKEQLHDIVDFLVDLCLGSPAVSALRAMQKVFKEDELPFHSALANSYQIGAGFISLFNKPESIGIIHQQEGDSTYYQQVLNYCIDGNIQSMLDEYFYLLKDSNSVKTPSQLADSVSSILSIRSSNVDIGSIEHLKKPGKEKARLRTHFAMDFGQQKLSSASANRQINVREAFNSPFRPFVLASTSIGQEGLDFHFYSKKIVHWNLPSNPIDFEQREGRIHRYKGHVIRLNIARKYAKQLKNMSDGKHLWDKLFDHASCEILSTNSKFTCQLVPYWHVEPEEDLSIERIVPLYPYSKDIDKYQHMLKVLAYYRFTFGQPRQDELIHILHENAANREESLLDELMINLSPIKFDSQLT